MKAYCCCTVAVCGAEQDDAFIGGETILHICYILAGIAYMENHNKVTGIMHRNTGAERT